MKDEFIIKLNREALSRFKEELNDILIEHIATNEEMFKTFDDIICCLEECSIEEVEE